MYGQQYSYAPRYDLPGPIFQGPWAIPLQYISIATVGVPTSPSVPVSVYPPLPVVSIINAAPRIHGMQPVEVQQIDFPPFLLQHSPFLSVEERTNKRRHQKDSDGSANEEEFMSVVNEVMPWATDLCATHFGKQTVRRFLSILNQPLWMKPTLFQFVSHISLSRDIRDGRGSRFIQQLATINDGDHNVSIDILKRLEREFVELCVHSRANYAIKTICSNIKREDMDFLIRLAAPYATRLSMDKHGAYVLQAILNRASRFQDQVQHSEIFQNMIANLVDIGLPLVMDKHGNYSAQALIPCLTGEHAKTFATMLSKHILICVSDRIGSRVVERMLEEGAEQGKRILVRVIVNLNEEELKVFRSFETSFYVIQKALNGANPNLKRRLLHKLSQ